MRRTPHVNDAFDLIRCGIDQGDRIRSNRNDSQRLTVRRKTESVNKKLPFVERTQSSRHRVAKSYNTEQLVLSWIDYRNRVRRLIRGVNAVMTGDWNIFACPRRLLCRHA